MYRKSREIFIFATGEAVLMRRRLGGIDRQGGVDDLNKFAQSQRKERHGDGCKQYCYTHGSS